MAAHHYSVGERVLYTEQRFPHLICKQPYTIIRCLASKRPEPQYQIRSSARPCDCIASEDELRHERLPLGAFQEMDVPGFVNSNDMGDAANLNLVPWASLPRRAQHKNEQPRLPRH